MSPSPKEANEEPVTGSQEVVPRLLEAYARADVRRIAGLTPWALEPAFEGVRRNPAVSERAIYDAVLKDRIPYVDRCDKLLDLLFLPHSVQPLETRTGESVVHRLRTIRPDIHLVRVTYEDRLRSPIFAAQPANGQGDQEYKLVKSFVLSLTQVPKGDVFAMSVVDDGTEFWPEAGPVIASVQVACGGNTDGPREIEVACKCLGIGPGSPMSVELVVGNSARKLDTTAPTFRFGERMPLDLSQVPIACTLRATDSQGRSDSVSFRIESGTLERNHPSFHTFVRLPWQKLVRHPRNRDPNATGSCWDPFDKNFQVADSQVEMAGSRHGPSDHRDTGSTPLATD